MSNRVWRGGGVGAMISALLKTNVFFISSSTPFEKNGYFIDVCINHSARFLHSTYLFVLPSMLVKLGQSLKVAFK